MLNAEDMYKGPNGKTRISWWRATKRDRGAIIAQMPKHRRNHHLDRLHHEARMIKKSYSTYSNYDSNYYSVYSFGLHVGLNIHERRKLCAQKRGQLRRTLTALRDIRIGSGGPLARLERQIEGNPPFIFDIHSGYIPDEYSLMDAMNAGINFDILTFRMPEGKAIQIARRESYLKHSGYWFYEVHEKDHQARDFARDVVRVLFYFSSPADLTWFKLRYG